MSKRANALAAQIEQGLKPWLLSARTCQRQNGKQLSQMRGAQCLPSRNTVSAAAVLGAVLHQVRSREARS